MAGGGPRGVTWNEDDIAKHEEEAGKEYGTMTIAEAVTPFLYYSETLSRDDSAVGEFVPGSGKTQVDIESLQRKLGILSEMQQTHDLSPPPAPWLMFTSRTYEGEVFYYNPLSRTAQWERPEPYEQTDLEEAEARAEDDDEPITVSRLTRAMDCAADYVERAGKRTGHRRVN